MINNKNIKNIEIILEKDKEGFYKKIKGIDIDLADKNEKKNINE